jgi:peptidoglycan-associated lipoprotein
MNSRRYYWLAMLAVMYLGIVGAQQCGQKADTAIKGAQQAVEEAKAVDAPRYAPNEYKSAEESLASAQGLFKKWSFKKSEEQAATAESQAKLAKKIALEQKAREQEEIARLQALQKSSFDENQPGMDDLARQALRDVNFDYDSAGLSPAAKSQLTSNAAFLQAHPNLRVRIEGHCDERGTDEYNLALGAKRAKAVQEFVVKQGISPGRVETISFGESMPLDPGHSEAAYAVNRRGHFAVIQ